MLDIVTDRETKTPDAEMGERIRYHALEEGLLLIAVKNYVRFCPPTIGSPVRRASAPFWSRRPRWSVGTTG